MFKLFVLCFAILSLTCAVQCTPTAVKRDQPSLKPEVHAARGHCDFQCPHENVVGKELSKSYADSGRLYCRYDVEELDNKAFCMYKRNTGELLTGSSLSECNRQAVFHCPGAKSGQQEVGWVAEQAKVPRSVNLPQFVKARSIARRARGANTV